MAINYNYTTLNVGTTPNDPSAQTLRSGMMDVNANFQITINNFMAIERLLTGIGVQSHQDIIRTYDFSRMCEYPYFGGLNDNGAWMIRNMEGSVVMYANIRNNPTYMTLMEAFNDRTSLTYNIVADLVF